MFISPFSREQFNPASLLSRSLFKQWVAIITILGALQSGAVGFDNQKTIAEMRTKAVAELSKATEAVNTLQSSIRANVAAINDAVVTDFSAADFLTNRKSVIAANTAGAYLDNKITDLTSLVHATSLVPEDLFNATDSKTPNGIAQSIVSVLASSETLNNLTGKTETYVTVWHGKQLAIAAAKTAADAAAQAAADAVATPNSVNNANQSGPNTFNVYVRVAQHGDAYNNGQAEENKGGQIATTFEGVGTIVAAHNYSDPTALRLRVGDTVNFTGAMEGSYHVVNSMTVHGGDPVTEISALGTTVFMQTCYFSGGNMRMVGLAPN